MPVYEYEPDDRDCFMCEGRVEVMQAASEEPLRHCPYCGLDVKRVVSRATFKLAGEAPAQGKGGQRGFTTFRRAEKGVYERVDGEGPEIIAAPKEDAPAKPKKVLDLDKD